MAFSLGEVDKRVFSEVVHTIAEATGEIFHEVMEGLELDTKNCRHFLQWDLLHKELLKKFRDGRLVAVLRQRGPWGFVLLYDPECNIIISLLKKKRLSSLQAERRRRLVPHYMDALTLLNKDLPARQEKMAQAFVERSAQYDKDALVLLESLCAGFMMKKDAVSVPRHVLVCFDSQRGMLTSVNAYVLNAELEIVQDKDLSEFISIDIGFEESRLDVEKTTMPKLKLTGKALGRAGKSTRRKLRPSQSDEIAGEGA